MRIQSLQLNQIGVFENERIEFNPCPGKGKAEIHIFTGTNGSGKSTILQVIAFVEYFRRQYKILDNSVFNQYYRSNEFGNTFRKKLNGSFYVNFENELTFFLDKISFEPSTKDPNYIIYSGDEKINELNENYINKPMRHFTFAYSGYRFIDHEENINISQNKKFDILKKSLEFHKQNDDQDISLNQWLANKISQRNSAAYDGDKIGEKKYGQSIEILKKLCEDIIGYPIDFKFKHEALKVVVVQESRELDFDLLPDGLRSILSWLGDLIMRMDQLSWEGDINILERPFTLLLDEVEVHLHPYWQRRVLPVIQKSFPNAQVFISTHSPFVVNSVDNAWVYNLEVEKGNAHVRKLELSQDGNSITSVLRNIFGVKETFGPAIEKDLTIFKGLISKALDKSISSKEEKELAKIAQKLAQEGTELESVVGFEIRQVEKLNKKELAL